MTDSTLEFGESERYPSPMASITQLEYLIALDRERHFSRAAEACNVAQPSLSNQLMKLENELGVTLFDRHKKPIEPTEIGQRLIDQARVILREHSKLSSLSNESRLEPGGNFTLAVIPTLAPYLVPLFLNDFIKTYPKVNLRIVESKTHEIIHQLEDDLIDAGLLVTPLHENGILERVLFYEPFGVYVSPDHILSELQQIEESDLSSQDPWLLEEGHCFRDQALKLCSIESRKSRPGNIAFASGNLETLKHLIQKSPGYTLLPQLAINQLSDSERKGYIRPFKNPAPVREVSLVHHRDLVKKTIMQAIEGKIQSNLPEELKAIKKDSVEVIGIYS